MAQRRNIFQRIWSSFARRPQTPKQLDVHDVVSPGRVSVPDDEGNIMYVLRGQTKLITPTYRAELVPLLRDLYKINPDVSISVQDMFKLSNTSHNISFLDATSEEADKMRSHLSKVTRNWSRYTAGIDGLVNRMIVQCLIGGAISVEAVPNRDLTGIATILFIKPETIFFQRQRNGVYQPYQRNPLMQGNKKARYIKLNPETYTYVGMYNDLDEPYGIPPFLGALDSLTGQHEMRENFKHIMELVGMVGFLEAKMEKPARRASESETAYANRLQSLLQKLKSNLKETLKDGVVVGYKDDHEFNMNATSKSLDNLNVPWVMNQQSVANGLGVNGNIIGISSSNTEGGSGVLLSKMISQLKNIQMLVKFVLEKVYALELRLAGFKVNGVRVTFGTSTISDELKVQQGLQYKIANLTSLYNQGIISQEQFAWEMGYDTPDLKDPRLIEEADPVSEDIADRKRSNDKDKSERRTRDKANTTPKRKDQDPKER